MTGDPRLRLRRSLATCALLAAGVAGGCSEIPRDPAGTLAEARGQVLRVGLAEGATEAERAVVERLASSIEARVAWERGGAPELLERLERRELAIVAAGLAPKTPWQSRVAVTRPIDAGGGREVVLATPPGENALLVALERQIGAVR